MSFYMEDDGVKLDFSVRNYIPSTDENSDDNWCKIDFTFKHPNGIDYSLLNDEAISAAEIEWLEESLSDLLAGKGDFDKTIECIEPYFEFHLTREEKYITVEWIVKLWAGGSPSECYFVVPLYEKDVEKLRDYLRTIMEK